MILTPLGTNVVVQIDPKVDTSAGGLYMPDTAEKPRMTGVVIGVGAEVSVLSFGDRVYVTYKDAFATTIQDVWIFPEKSILAIVS